MEAFSKFETKVLAAFAAAVLVVAMLAVATWKVSRDAIEAALQVSRTHEVLYSLAQARGDTLLIELSTQSYRISGDAAQVVERDAAISAREASLRRINELTADDARQQESWTRLRKAVDERLEIARRTVLLRKTEGLEAASAYIASVPLRETRERLFQMIRGMEQEERRLLEERSAEQLRVRDIAVGTSALAALALVALLSATYFLIRWQLRATEGRRRALEVVNARIAAIFDTVADGIITITERGMVETLNPAAERVFGYTASEVVGHNVKMLMPEPYHSQHDDYLEHYRATGEARIIGSGREVVGRRKDGSTFPLELAVSEMRLGGERHYTGVVRDISERKQAEDQFNRFFGLSLDMLCISSADGYFKRVSPAFTKTLGWSTGEILARPFLDFVHPDDQAATLREVARQVNAGEDVLQFENRYLHKDGSWRVLSWRSVPNEGGLMFATARDITGSKEAEQALKLESERLDLALRSAGMAMWNSDLRTGRVSLDERWAKIIGGEPGPCVTTSSDLLKLVPTEHRDRLLAAASDITSGRATKYRVEHQVRTKSGEWRWIESQGETVDWDTQGRALRLIGLNHDITERKQAEQDLVAARDEAQRANTIKDTFLATMSHEIRTPLNGLLGMLELLSLSRLDSEQRESLEIARDSGRGLVRIIDDVLDHSKIEAGKLEIRPEPVSIAQLLRRVLNTYHAVASAKDLTLKQAMDPHISPSLLADPLRVLQILNNLVSNALKFTADGYVEVRAELLGRAGGADTVCLSVKDTGIGIDPEAQQRLFQPFEQAGAVTARLYGGTGLGLSISRRLAEMMGGSIRVKSALGEGTTMSLTLTLPISDDAPAEHGRQTTAVPLLATGESPLVLAVDDHSTNRELLARQLAALGLRVRKAADGQEALALWQGGGFAVVITDCNMPQMDGYALSRAIREIEAKEGRRRTLIIAWTANVLPGAGAQCHAAGMDDILTKPADLAILKETISKWLGAAAMMAASLVDAGHERGGGIHAAPFSLTELDKIAATAAERAEILLDFMTQTRSDLAALGAALKEQDLPTSVRIAHRMKGSSRMVGARELAVACETMEHAARQGNQGDAGAAKTAMDSALERLDAHLAGAAGANGERT